MTDDGFSEKQLVQLRTIFEGERFHTEKMIDRKLSEGLQPIKQNLEEVKATVKRIDERDQEDTSAITTTLLKHDREIGTLKKQVAVLSASS